jgi:hypothetical protein
MKGRECRSTILIGCLEHIYIIELFIRTKLLKSRYAYWLMIGVIAFIEFLLLSK